MPKKSNNRGVLVATGTAFVTTALIIGQALPSAAYFRPTKVRQVDRPSRPPAPIRPTDRGAGFDSISDNGRWVAFSSAASDYVPQDPNLINDVFTVDLKNGRTKIISNSSRGESAIAPPFAVGSYGGQLSANGRYIAFASDAVNLVEGDTNGLVDVFVHDQRNKTTTRVSVDSRGDQAEGGSYLPSISGNGRFVSFTSQAPNLVSGDTNDAEEVFRHDRKTGRTIRVSVRSGGAQSRGGACKPPLTPDPFVNDQLEFRICYRFRGEIPLKSSLSQDGRLVVFDSAASDLVDGDTNIAWDIFVHDVKTRKTERVSVASDGAQTTPWCHPSQPDSLLAPGPRKAISADGRYVVFGSFAPNLVPNDTSHAHTDVFVHDRRTGRTERVTVYPDGRDYKQRCVTPTFPANGHNWGSISGNGRYVMTRWGAGATSPARYDRLTGEVAAIVPCRSTGGPWSSCPRGPTIGPADIMPAADFNGRLAAFGAPYYFRSDDFQFIGNSVNHVFLWDVGPPLGVGGFEGSASGGEPPNDDRICIGDNCIPPGGSVAFTDELDDVNETVAERGANLIGGRVTNRAPLGDLYVVLELESMPRTPALAAATAGLVYGMLFEIDGDPYEMRIASTGLGPNGETAADFGLFSCSPGELLCSKIEDLKGGFGTTGERITFSVPLDELEIQKKSAISDVTAFTAVGTFLGGGAETLDEATLEKK